MFGFKSMVSEDEARLPCRILYVIGQLGSGGSERQLYYFLNAMDRERYRPAVIAWNFCETEVYVPKLRALGIPVYYFPGKLSAAGKFRALRCLVARLRPEIVHSYSFYLNFPAYATIQRTGAIAVGSFRGDFTQDKKSTPLWLGRLSARWPRAQICNSFSAAETVRRLGSFFSPRHLSVVRNSIDLDYFSKAPVLVTGPACIAGLGSLIGLKRWDRLIAAAMQLKRKGFAFLVRIVGEGVLRESLEQRALQLGVADRVELSGYSDNIPALLADSTFLVHTSDSEGCPNAVMEAMACGRAVVATDAGDVPFLIDDGYTGFVVRRGDDEALVDRILRLITDRDLCRRMGEAGRSKAEREFGLNRLVEETLAAYQAAGWRG